MIKKPKIKCSIPVSKKLLQRFFDDRESINKSAFQRECGVSNIIGHLQKPNEFSERMRRKIGSVLINYGYIDWVAAKNIQEYDGPITNIYESDKI